MSQDQREQDYALVEAFKAGDEDAFARLYERTHEKVYRVAFKILRNHDDALDIAQDTFVTAHRSLKSFERRAKVSTWLCQIAVHRAIDLTRKRKRRNSESTEYQAATNASKLNRGEVLDVAPADPIRQAVGGELEERLADALAQLGEKHRSVFVLYTLEGLSYKGIAEELEISIGTVMSRLFYARRKLQGLLAAFAEGRPGS